MSETTPFGNELWDEKVFYVPHENGIEKGKETALP